MPKKVMYTKSELIAAIGVFGEVNLNQVTKKILIESAAHFESKTVELELDIVKLKDEKLKLNNLYNETYKLLDEKRDEIEKLKGELSRAYTQIGFMIMNNVMGQAK